MGISSRMLSKFREFLGWMDGLGLSHRETSGIVCFYVAIHEPIHVSLFHRVGD